MENKRLYKLSEIEELFGISKGYMLSLINKKKIEAFKIGNIWRVKTEDLEKLLAESSNLS